MSINLALTGITVMIVEDSVFMRTLLREMLDSCGCSVLAEAIDGNEAVAKYKKYRPQISLIDVLMPEKDGMEATIEILSFDKNAKVILCSTIDHGTVASTALKIGAKDVITKPYDLSNIQEVLNRVIRL
jgi:two-component system, chemotaxis family, chemotaxis protein CheY